MAESIKYQQAEIFGEGMQMLFLPKSILKVCLPCCVCTQLCDLPVSVAPVSQCLQWACLQGAEGFGLHCSDPLVMMPQSGLCYQQSP